MKLKYSSVQQPELVGYLALLNPENLEIEQVAGYCDAVRNSGRIARFLTRFCSR